METKIIMFFILSLMGCKVNHNQNSKVNNTDSLEAYKLERDTFYNIEFINDEKYLIKWGTLAFQNVSKDTFFITGTGYLDMTDSNNKYFILRESCGTNCVLYVVLPLLPNRREMTFYPVVYHDLDKETIITTKDPSAGIFEITNYGNTTHQEITLEEMCPAADKSSCIDSISMVSDNIIFYYQGNKWAHRKLDNRMKIIKF